MKRFVRVLASLVCCGAALLGILYVGQGLVGMAHVAAAKKQAAADLTAALPAGERRATAGRERVRTSLSGVGAPAYSWQELVCELDTNDVGWIVDEYVQQCDIRSVDLVPVTRAAPGGCESLYFPRTLDAARSGTVGVRRGSSTVLASARPWAQMCPDGLTGPPLIGTSRMLDGQRPTSLSSSPAWIVVETTTPVSRTVLGCDPWTVVFCTEPVDAPVVPITGKSAGPPGPPVGALLGLSLL